MPIAPEKLQNLDPEFTRRLQAAVAAAEAATGATTPITDAYRDSKTQAQYYANYTQKPVTWEGVTYKPQKQGGLAAAPGQSYHQSGKAVDIASGPVLDWLHKNAGQYGLEFLPGAAGKMDPVHIQLAGSNAQFAGNPFGVTGTAIPPPLPNLRQNAMAMQGVNPWDAAPAPLAPPGAAPPSAPQAPTQLASSWLPPSLQNGGQGFVDNLGGGMSPLVNAKVAESSDVPAGPFGTDALVRAAMAGDQAGVQKALGDVMGAAIGAIFSGKGSKDQITQQINDYLSGLATSAPGAARAIQAASTANPQLFSALAPDQQAQVKAALAGLPPQATAQVAMPNLRPPGLSGPPLVAGPTPDPLAPKMAAYTPPPFASGDNLDMRSNPGSANASLVAYSPPAPNAAGLAQMLGRSSQPQPPQAPPPPPAPDFNSFFDPSSAMAAPQFPQPPQPPSPSYGPPPFPSPGSLNPTQMRGLEGPTGQGSINFMPPMAAGQPFFGIPASQSMSPMLSSLTGGYGPALQSLMTRSPMLSSLTGGYGAAPGWLVPPTTTQARAPSWMPPRPMAQPMAPPPAAYTPLPDYGSVTPPSSPQSQALYDAYQNQGDSYLNFPAFDFGLN